MSKKCLRNVPKNHVSDDNCVSWGICNPQLLASKLMIESGGQKNVPEMFQKMSPKSGPQNDPKSVPKWPKKSHLKIS